MAAFLVRALGLVDREPEFVDDDESIFEGDIERLAAAGITRGCNPPQRSFLPRRSVTRPDGAFWSALGLNVGGGQGLRGYDGIGVRADIGKLAVAGITGLQSARQRPFLSRRSGDARPDGGVPVPGPFVERLRDRQCVDRRRTRKRSLVRPCHLLGWPVRFVRLSRRQPGVGRHQRCLRCVRAGSGFRYDRRGALAWEGKRTEKQGPPAQTYPMMVGMSSSSLIKQPGRRDENGLGDVFLRDRSTGVTIRSAKDPMAKRTAHHKRLGSLLTAVTLSPYATNLTEAAEVVLYDRGPASTISDRARIRASRERSVHRLRDGRKVIRHDRTTGNEVGWMSRPQEYRRTPRVMRSDRRMAGSSCSSRKLNPSRRHQRSRRSLPPGCDRRDDGQGQRVTGDDGQPFNRVSAAVSATTATSGLSTDARMP